MKKTVFICLLCPVLSLAQKEIKPSVSKAESALQKGTLDEAKAIIDATVASTEYMVDKKGNPSKNATKAWYLRGLIYTAIDTTKVEKFKSLEADPFAVAKQSFEKCNCQYASYNLVMGMTKEDVKKYFGEPSKTQTPDQWIYNGNTLIFKDNKLSAFQAKDQQPMEAKSENMVSRLYMGLPVPTSNMEAAKFVAQAYLNRALDTYKKKDYKKAFVDIEKVLFFIPNDTTQILNAGVYFAPQAQEIDKAIVYINKYISFGGKNTDAPLQLYFIYFQRKDYDNALKAIKILTTQYPNNTDFLNNEYNIYIQTNNLTDAKAAMLRRAQSNPNDSESRLFLALISKKMEKNDEAKQWLVDALKIDPDYFDANGEMYGILSQEARSLNDQRNATKDTKKRLELFNARFAKLKEALVFAEKCASIKTGDEASLYGLLSLYDNLSTYDESYEKKSTELKKKMKALGLDVD